jgi:hypothetical protein
MLRNELEIFYNKNLTTTSKCEDKNYELPLKSKFFKISVARKIKISNFSCRFLNPNNFFQFELQLFYFLTSEKPPGTS